MTTQTTQDVNGRTRKSLASEIDRLDGILDGLSEGLNEAVAMVTKEAVQVAVREAVQSVLTEILTNPAVLAKLQASLIKNMPKPASKPAVTWKERWTKVGQTVANGCRAVGQKCRTGLRWVGQSVASLAKSVVQLPGQVVQKSFETAAKVAAHLWIVRQFKRQFLVALLVGTLAGVAAYLAGPWLAVLASAVGGFATTATVQILLWCRNLLLGFADSGTGRGNWANDAVAAS